VARPALRHCEVVSREKQWRIRRCTQASGVWGAIQVADRFDPSKNLGDVLLRVFQRRSEAVFSPCPLPVFTTNSQHALGSTEKSPASVPGYTDAKPLRTLHVLLAKAGMNESAPVSAQLGQKVFSHHASREAHRTGYADPIERLKRSDHELEKCCPVFSKVSPGCSGKERIIPTTLEHRHCYALDGGGTRFWDSGTKFVRT
jgi:hypothetical protein